MDAITMKEAARILDRCPATVRELADSGKLPHVRTSIGFRVFNRADVERLAKTMRKGEAGR